jgi:fibro-slime domain-containing protein
MVSAVALALTTACGNDPVEASDTDAATQSTVTDSTVGATDSTPATDSGSDTQSSAPTGGMSNSGTSEPTTSTDTTNSTPATPGTTDTVDTTDSTPATPGTTDSDSADTGDTSTTSDTSDTSDTTMGVVDTGDTGDTSTTSDDTTKTSDDTTTTEEPPDPCEPVLHATIRDFAFSHPDFENYGGNTAYKGLVLVDLGPDMKPVYAAPGPTPQTTGPNEFKHWYNDTPGINQTFEVDLPLAEIQPGLFQFADNTFFPVDNQGFGNEGQPNNFAFTTEIHTTFAYNGGETFTFTGDDDVWVFINGKLAIDLGGLHPQLSDMISLDAEAANLGIVPGNVYPMDLFHAERHTNQSNFRIDTTIGCFKPQ